jgi:hypothetical protein
MFETYRERLLQSLDAAHTAYYNAGTFGGPSLYFHLRALEAGKAGDCGRFADSAYALLTSWGMHRMGSRGAKMLEFEEFEASLRPLWPTVLHLQQAPPENLGENDWCELGDVFRGIKCMKTGTSLVSNSKVMAHALPNLVAPVDRQYTLRFLFDSTNIANDRDQEWETLQAILRGFFYPVVRAETFRAKAREWQAEQARFRWDTSPLKIADNLLIGLLKREGVDEAAPEPS